MLTPHCEHQDEVDILLEEMRQVEEKHAGLLQGLNSARASTRALPVETLSLIFEHACPPVFNFFPESRWVHHPQAVVHTAPLTLGHVSSHWRQVAWSTPQLWDSVSIRIGENMPLCSIPDLLELYLRNSKNLPFHLEINNSYARSISSDIIQLIRTILFHGDYCRKFRTLKLPAIDRSSSWLPLSADFPQLQHISLRGYRKQEVSLQTTPHLQHLFLSGVASRVVSIPWSSLTMVDLFNIPICTSARLLAQCPNLVEYSASLFSPAEQEAPEPHFLHSTTTLHSLKELFWIYDESPWCLAANRRIQLPALYKLTWGENSWLDPDEVKPAVHALFTNLPSLTILELNNLSPWTFPTIEHVFSHCSSLKELTLRECIGVSTYRIFCVLCSGREADEEIYLPSLTSLTVVRVGDGYPGEPAEILDREYSCRILDICRVRFIGPGSRFSFRFEEHVVKWARGVRRQLRTMVRNGFQLELTDKNGEQIGRNND